MANSGRTSLTPDGKHVLYLSSESGTQAASIRPLDGGTPKQLANVYAFEPVPSPDGKSLAFVSVDEKNQAVFRSVPCRTARRGELFL